MGEGRKKNKRKKYFNIWDKNKIKCLDEGKMGKMQRKGKENGVIGYGYERGRKILWFPKMTK